MILFPCLLLLKLPNPNGPSEFKSRLGKMNKDHGS